MAQPEPHAETDLSAFRHFSFPAHGVSVVTDLILLPRRNRVITSSDDHQILVYSLATGERLHTLEGHEGGIWALAIPDEESDTLVSGSTDRTVRVWDLAKGRCTHVFDGHVSTVRCLAIVHPTADPSESVSRSVIVSGSRDNSLTVWALPRPDEPEYGCVVDPEEAAGEREVSVNENPFYRFDLRGHTGAVRGLAARGRTAISASYDCTLRVWDLVTSKCLHVLRGHTQKIYSVVLHPTRPCAYSGSMDHTVRMWDTNTGECLRTMSNHTSLVGLLQLSPSYLVSAAADATLCTWDPDTGELRQTYRGHTGAVTCFQHDDKKVVSGSDGALKVWDIETGKAVRDLLSGIIGVWQVVFAGQWCVAASNREDRTMLDVWDFGEDHERAWLAASEDPR